MLPSTAIQTIRSGSADAIVKDLLAIDPKDLNEYKTRLTDAVASFCDLYGDGRDISVFSVGGRSEISGNHTDHNGGKVIAAAINLDIICVASPRDDGVIRIKSEGFDEDVVEKDEGDAPDPEKRFKSSALIAGMKHAFKARGYAVGGFDAYTVSNVIKGSGLSSSAAFEVAVGKMLSYFYNTNNVDTKEIALSAQYAENVFYGKPCGLMDQLACVTGGLSGIDFSSPADPTVKSIAYDFTKSGLSLCITNTGSSHSDLSSDYAAVAEEMRSVAALFSKSRLCELDRAFLDENASLVRRKLGDRALLRAYHFFDETERVDEQISSLEKGDTDSFLSLVRESGRSSYCYLQNVYTAAAVTEQPIALALYHSERFLKDLRGAWRIQGGGFAGTVEAFVPTDAAHSYKEYMEKNFGADSCKILSVRPAGAVKII